MVTNALFRRVLQWGSAIVLACVFCLGSGPSSTTSASTRALPSRTQQASAAHVNSGSANARTANAGVALSIDGTGKGSSTPPVLSAQQQRHKQEMLERMDHPIPVPEGKPSAPTPAPAPTTVSNDVGGPLQPQTAITVRASDLGGGSSSKESAPSTTGAITTWNWYAEMTSLDGTKTYYDPATLFPNSYGGWCCNSAVLSGYPLNLTIWNLVYLPNASGGAFRLAIANSGSDFENVIFHYWDLKPQQTGGVRGDWYGGPVFSQSQDHVYLQASVYHAKATIPYRTVVMRFSVFALFLTDALHYEFFNAPGVRSVAFIPEANIIMYFAGHLSTTTLRIFSWPTISETVSWIDIVHTRFATGHFECPRTGVADSNWCGNADSRLLSGWLIVNGWLAFSWNAPQGKWGFRGSAPYPYTDIVVVNLATKTLMSEPIIWNSDYAFLDMSMVDANYYGGVFLYGGGSRFETVGVTIWDDRGQDFVGILQSTQDATVAGSYLTTVSTTYSWVAAVYTMLADGVHPYYIAFHRPGRK